MRHWNSQNREKVVETRHRQKNSSVESGTFACELCGSDFQKRQNHQRFCTPACRRKAEVARLSPEQKARRDAQNKQWSVTEFGKVRRKASYEKNKDSILSQRRERRREFPEILHARDNARTERKREYLRDYVRKNRWRWADTEYKHSKARRARISGAQGSFTRREFFDLCEKYKFLCLRCEQTFPAHKLTADHVLPLCKGGSNYIDNIQPLCLSCNCRKHRKHIDYRPKFARSGGVGENENAMG